MNIDKKYINGVYGGTPTSQGYYNTTSAPLYNQGVANAPTASTEKTASYPAYNQGVANVKPTSGAGSTVSTPKAESTANTASRSNTIAPITDVSASTANKASYGSSSSTSSSNNYTTVYGGSNKREESVGYVNPNTQSNFNQYSQNYSQSQMVTDAYNALQAKINANPGKYSSAYTEALNNLYNQIQNREDFSYSVKNDSLYDIYQQKYESAGKTSMQDVMGQYAANTGGYSNSYGETAGFQAYQNYLNQLQNTVPDLYTMAYNRYKDKVDIDMNKYDIMKGRDDTEYGRFQDSITNWASDRDYLNNYYQATRDFDSYLYNANRDYWQNEYWNEKNAIKNIIESHWGYQWDNPGGESGGGSGGGSNTPSGVIGYDRNGTPILGLGSDPKNFYDTHTIIGYKDGLPIFDY